MQGNNTMNLLYIGTQARVDAPQQDEMASTDSGKISVLVEGSVGTKTLPAPIPDHPMADTVGAFANSAFFDAVVAHMESNRRPWWKFWMK